MERLKLVDWLGALTSLIAIVLILVSNVPFCVSVLGELSVFQMRHDYVLGRKKLRMTLPRSLSRKEALCFHGLRLSLSLCCCLGHSSSAYFSLQNGSLQSCPYYHVRHYAKHQVSVDGIIC
jgi:hypothetical protein